MANTNAQEHKEVTLGDILDVLVSMQNSLEQISMWQKIFGAEKVKGLLNSVLDTREKRLAYHLSDGEMTRDEISAAIKVSTGAISGYWNTWHRLGLMNIQKIKGRERYVRNFDLTDFNIEVPKLKADVTQVASARDAPTQATLSQVIEGKALADGGNT